MVVNDSTRAQRTSSPDVILAGAYSEGGLGIHVTGSES